MNSEYTMEFMTSNDLNLNHSIIFNKSKLIIQIKKTHLSNFFKTLYLNHFTPFISDNLIVKITIYTRTIDNIIKITKTCQTLCQSTRL